MFPPCVTELCFLCLQLCLPARVQEDLQQCESEHLGPMDALPAESEPLPRPGSEEKSRYSVRSFNPRRRCSCFFVCLFFLSLLTATEMGEQSSVCRWKGGHSVPGSPGLHLPLFIRCGEWQTSFFQWGGNACCGNEWMWLLPTVHVT